MLENARCRVLVVDDESDIRGLIGSMLDATDLPHDDVRDGAEALDRLSAREYEAVILDLMMPGTDGLAVLGTLAAARPELLSRIIVLTGGTDALVARIDHQVFRVMRKPFSPRELLEIVRECLDHKASPEPGPDPSFPEPVATRRDESGRPQIRLAKQGGFIIDFPGVDRWWVEGDVEPFRSEGRSLKGAMKDVFGRDAEEAATSGIVPGIPMEQSADSIRGMLLDLESLGMAVRID